LSHIRRRHAKLAVLIPNEETAGHLNTVAGFRAGGDQFKRAEMRVIRHDGTPVGVERCLEQRVKKNEATGILVAIPQFVVTAISFLAISGVLCASVAKIPASLGERARWWGCSRAISPFPGRVVAASASEPGVATDPLQTSACWCSPRPGCAQRGDAPRVAGEPVSVRLRPRRYCPGVVRADPSRP